MSLKTKIKCMFCIKDTAKRKYQNILKMKECINTRNNKRKDECMLTMDYSMYIITNIK